MLIGSNCILRIIFFFLKQRGGERVVYQNLIEVVQLLSPIFVIPWTAAHQASLSFTVSLSLLRLMSIEPLMPSSHLILCVPLHLWSSIFPASGSYPMYRLVEFSAFLKELRFELICFSIFFQLVIIAVKRDKGCVNIHYLEKHKYFFNFFF